MWVVSLAVVIIGVVYVRVVVFDSVFGLVIV